MQYGAHNATVSHVYTFDAGDTASGAYNVAVTDRATNQTTVPFTVTRDAITATVIEANPAQVMAYPMMMWPLQMGRNGNVWSVPALLPGSGLPDGVLTVTVTAQDRTNHMVSRVLTYTVDNTPPGATLNITENSPYAYVNGSTVYYGPNSGSFTLTVTAADATAGLDAIVFPATVSAGEVYSQYGAHTAAVSHVYTFDAGDTANGTYNVAVTDRATSQTTVPFTVTRDATAPTLTLTVAERIAASDIPVQWTAVEAGSGIRGCDLEVSADGGASWTRLLTETQATTYTFTGTPGVAYTFRVRATDNVSNTSAWVQAVARTVVVKKYYTVAGQRIGMRENGVLYYLHGDHLGSTSLTTDETGAVVAEQKYLPYGEVRWSSGSLPTDRQFTGQRREASLGDLYDYRARFFSPRLGRFLSADTLVPGVGSLYLNRYMYTNGNPVKWQDPSGHAPVYFDAGEGMGSSALYWEIVSQVGTAGSAYPASWNKLDTIDQVQALRAYAAYLENPEYYRQLYMNPGSDPISLGYLQVWAEYAQGVPLAQFMQLDLEAENYARIDAARQAYENGRISAAEYYGSIALPVVMIGLISLSESCADAGTPWLGNNVKTTGKVRSGRLAGYQSATSDVPGGLHSAEKAFEAFAGRAPTIDNPSSWAPTDSYIGADLEVQFRPSSRTGTPVIEVINHGTKTIEKIHFNR